jgi:TolA-binding protein
MISEKDKMTKLANSMSFKSLPINKEETSLSMANFKNKIIDLNTKIDDLNTKINDLKNTKKIKKHTIKV